MADEVGIGLLGCGTVGQGVVKLLTDSGSPLWERLGKRLVLRKVLDLDLDKLRQLPLDPSALTTDPKEIFDNPDIDIVIELIGGIEPACGFILQALENNKHVVTANKALLAEAGGPIFKKAAEKNRHIGFEASVAGGIPILKAISEGFIANRIERVYGIVNGTCNYILSKMSEEKRPFDEVLKEAQEAGFAEADPSLDVDGIDAGHKLSILLTLCYGVQVPFKELYVEGIRQVTQLDLEFAERLGYSLKHLAIAREKSDGIEARVHLTLIPKDHLLTPVRGVMNAIYLSGDAVGEAMFYGAGAGSLPTASAVVSDVSWIASRLEESSVIDIADRVKSAGLKPISEWVGEFYLRFGVLDRPGVLAEIAGILGEHEISITAVYQPERAHDSQVPIVIMTHDAKEENVQRALKKIEELETVLEQPVLIRVEKG